MALYGVKAVQMHPKKDRISKVLWQEIDGAANKWIGKEEVVDVAEAANAIVSGDTVYSIHSIQGGTVHGGKAKQVVYDHGFEGIETAEPESHPGQTLRDLPTF